MILLSTDALINLIEVAVLTELISESINYTMRFLLNITYFNEITFGSIGMNDLPAWPSTPHFLLSFVRIFPLRLECAAKRPMLHP